MILALLNLPAKRIIKNDRIHLLGKRCSRKNLNPVRLDGLPYTNNRIISKNSKLLKLGERWEGATGVLSSLLLQCRKKKQKKNKRKLTLIWTFSYFQHKAKGLHVFVWANVAGKEQWQPFYFPIFFLAPLLAFKSNVVFESKTIYSSLKVWRHSCDNCSRYVEIAFCSTYHSAQYKSENFVGSNFFLSYFVASPSRIAHYPHSLFHIRKTCDWFHLST